MLASLVSFDNLMGRFRSPCFKLAQVHGLSFVAFEGQSIGIGGSLVSTLLDELSKKFLWICSKLSVNLKKLSQAPGIESPVLESSGQF